MDNIHTLCPPALIYLIFSLTQIIIDTFKGLYKIAFFKFIVMIIFTILLNTLCSEGLGIISWIIVFVPFFLMSIVTAILIFMFGLDPMTGRLHYKDVTHRQEKQHRDPRDPHHRDHHHRDPHHRDHGHKDHHYNDDNN